jgi:hypothetical protein
MRKLRACALSTTIYTSVIVIKHSQRRKAIRAVIILRLKGEGIESTPLAFTNKTPFPMLAFSASLAARFDGLDQSWLGPSNAVFLSLLLRGR